MLNTEVHEEDPDPENYADPCGSGSTTGTGVKCESGFGIQSYNVPIGLKYAENVK